MNDRIPVMDKPVSRKRLEARGSSDFDATKREIAVWKPAQHREYAMDITGDVSWKIPMPASPKVCDMNMR